MKNIMINWREVIVGSAMLCVSGVGVAQSTSLLPNQTLAAGGYLLPEVGDRPGCVFRATMAGTGNFALQFPRGVVWETKTGGNTNARLEFRADGNLAIMSASNRQLWTSNTSGRGGVKLVVGSDGLLSLLNAAQQSVWNVSTSIPACLTGPAGPTGPAGAPGAKAVALTSSESPGANCPRGGSRVQSFVDVNADGLYTPSIDGANRVAYICNGTAGTAGGVGADGVPSIVSRTPITPNPKIDLPNCPAGGIALKGFLDRDRSSSFSTGDTVIFEEKVCNGIRGVTGDDGAAGAKGATGARGATGVKAVVVGRTLPAEPTGPCPNGGKLYSSWTDVVADKDASGQPVYTASPVNGAVDIDLQESVVCAGPKGLAGLSVLSNIAPASAAECAQGGSVVGLYRDNNDNAKIDPSDTLVNSFTTCDGLRGADGFASIINASPLVSGSSACATGGVRFDICLDVDRNGVCGEGDEARSSPFVCNGANAAVAMESDAGFCDGLGGTKLTMYTDVDHSGTLSAPDSNISNSLICNGARGARGANSVVTFEPVPDTAHRCAVSNGLVKFTSFLDDNNNGEMDSNEYPSGTYSFCVGDGTADKTAMMEAVAGLIAGQMTSLRVEMNVSVGGLGAALTSFETRLSALESLTEESSATVEFIKDRVEAAGAAAEQLTSAIEALRSGVASSQATVLALNHQLSTIRVNIAAVNERLSAIESRGGSGVSLTELYALESQIMTAVWDLSGQVSSLRASIQSSGSNLCSASGNAVPAFLCDQAAAPAAAAPADAATPPPTQVPRFSTPEQYLATAQRAISCLDKEIWRLQDISCAQQGFVTTVINNGETDACPLGTGGRRISLCTVVNGSCDITKPISSVDVCNAGWSRQFVTGTISRLCAPGVVVKNGSATQTLAMTHGCQNNVEFRFPSSGGLPYNIEVTLRPPGSKSPTADAYMRASLPPPTLPVHPWSDPIPGDPTRLPQYVVHNGSGVVGSSDVMNIVITPTNEPGPWWVPACPMAVEREITSDVTRSVWNCWQRLFAHEGATTRWIDIPWVIDARVQGELRCGNTGAMYIDNESYSVGGINFKDCTDDRGTNTDVGWNRWVTDPAANGIAFAELPDQPLAFALKVSGSHQGGPSFTRTHSWVLENSNNQNDSSKISAQSVMWVNCWAVPPDTVLMETRDQMKAMLGSMEESVFDVLCGSRF